MYRHPLQHGSRLWHGVILSYLLLFSIYWASLSTCSNCAHLLARTVATTACLAVRQAWAVVHVAHELRGLGSIRELLETRAGISDRALQHMTWPELLDQVLSLQRSVRFARQRELDQHDAVNRIMRKDNYLV